jgi:hypothetical protein
VPIAAGVVTDADLLAAQRRLLTADRLGPGAAAWHALAEDLAPLGRGPERRPLERPHAPRVAKRVARPERTGRRSIAMA